MQQLAFDLKLPVHKTFDNFLVNPANSECIEYLEHMLAQASCERIYLYGESGSGRSHLLQAACNRLYSLAAPCIYLPCKTLLQYQPEMLENLASVSLIALDDIDLLAQQEAWERALFHLWNQLEARQTRLLVSSQHAPKDSGFRMPDLVSRLTQATIFNLSLLDDEEKVKVLKNYANSQGFELSNGLAIYMINHYERDLNHLLQLINQLNQASLETGKNPTIQLLKQLIKTSETVAS